MYSLFFKLIYKVLFRMPNIHLNMKLKNAEKNIYMNYEPINYKVRNVVKRTNSCDLSILIPTYNSEKYIERCLNSIFEQQTEYEYEVIIVNDGSTDRTSSILESFKDKYSNLTIIYQDNHGICYARNKCLSEANGKYITFVDSDDFLMPNFIQKMMEGVYSGDYDYVKCNYRIFDDRNHKSIIEHKVTQNKILNGINDNIIKMNGYLWAAIIKKDILQDISFAPNYWFEDMITRNIIIRKCQKLLFIDDTLYNYYVKHESATRLEGKGKNIKNLDHFFLFVKSMKYAEEIGIKKDVTYQYLMADEFLYMFAQRTLKLNKKTRKSIFIMACDYYKSNYIPNIDKMAEKIFLNKNYILWNMYYYYLKIKNKVLN